MGIDLRCMLGYPYTPPDAPLERVLGFVHSIPFGSEGRGGGGPQDWCARNLTLTMR